MYGHQLRILQTIQLKRTRQDRYRWGSEFKAIKVVLLLTTTYYPDIDLAVRMFPMAREIWVKSQVESYQRLKKLYLMSSCLTLSIIRFRSRVKWSNPRKGVAPSPTPWCSKLLKRETTLLLLFTYI